MVSEPADPERADPRRANPERADPRRANPEKADPESASAAAPALAWMTAAVLYGQRDVRVERIRVPRPGPGELLLRVEAALTDGTDLKVFRRGYHARMIVPPAVFGHEFAGVVVDTQHPSFEVGERVVAANSAPCGNCFFCERSQESLCEDLMFVNGAYAEYMLLPARLVQRNTLPLPPGLSFAKAALTEPLACVVKGIRDLGVQPGETVAILGSGPIGLMAARLCCLADARVILAGRREPQLQLARQLGAAIVIEPKPEDDLAAAIRTAAGRHGPDRVFEATGVPAIWEAAIQAVRSGGTVNLFGGCPAAARVALDTQRVHYGEVTIRSSFHHTPRDIRAALDLIGSGRMPAALLFEAEEPLERLPQVLEQMDRRLRTLKTVIRPGSPRVSSSSATR